jgi:hypothetical protein
MHLRFALALAALLLGGCRKTIHEAKAGGNPAHRPSALATGMPRARPPVILRYSDGPLVPFSTNAAGARHERSFAALRMTSG